MRKLKMLIIIGCIFAMTTQMFPLVSATFITDADYKTEFNGSTNDNCTVTLNSWNETYVTGWDLSKAAYFNESSNSTNDCIVTFKNGSSTITDAKGLYLEYKVTYNATNNNAGSLQLGILNSGGNIYLAIYPGTICYLQLTDGASSTYYNLELYQAYMGLNYHRIFVHFNNITGELLFGFDDHIYNRTVTPRAFVTTGVRVTLYNDGNPGIVLDNVKTLKDQDFPLNDYMTQYYSDFTLSYPPNNYDLAYAPMVHADYTTLGLVRCTFDLFNSHGIYVGQNYFFNNSASQAHVGDSLQVNTSFRTYVLSKTGMNEIDVHAFKMNTNLNTSQMRAILVLWKSLMGSYPAIFTDHGALQQDMCQNGSNVSSVYYLASLMNSSSMKYAWVNYGYRLSTPSGYQMGNRNILRSFQLGGNGAVYTNVVPNLFSSGSRVLYVNSSTVKYDYYFWTLANERGLALEHTYNEYFAYKNDSGTKYSYTTYAGYTSYPGGWNLYHNDTTAPWTIMPEFTAQLDRICARFTIYSYYPAKMLDRAVIYNSSSVYQDGTDIYVNTTSVLHNVTVSSRVNQTGKALIATSGDFYPFTKAFYAWGATIPSNDGNITYELVDCPMYFTDSGQIGRLEYRTDDNVSIHFKKTGSVTLQLSSNITDPTVENVTGGGTVTCSFTNENVTFTGSKDCEYLIYETPPTTPVVNDTDEDEVDSHYEPESGTFYVSKPTDMSSSTIINVPTSYQKRFWLFWTTTATVGSITVYGIDSNFNYVAVTYRQVGGALSKIKLVLTSSEFKTYKGFIIIPNPGYFQKSIFWFSLLHNPNSVFTKGESLE